MLHTKNAPSPEQHYEDVIKRLHKRYTRKQQIDLKDGQTAIRFAKRAYMQGNRIHVTDAIGYPLDTESMLYLVEQFGSCRAYVWS